MSEIRPKNKFFQTWGRRAEMMRMGQVDRIVREQKITCEKMAENKIQKSGEFYHLSILTLFSEQTKLRVMLILSNRIIWLE